MDLSEDARDSTSAEADQPTRRLTSVGRSRLLPFFALAVGLAAVFGGMLVIPDVLVLPYLVVVTLLVGVGGYMLV